MPGDDSDRDGKQIPACPSCDSANITPKQPDKPRAQTSPEPWYCNDCGTHFGEPDRRPKAIADPEDGRRGNFSAGGQALLDADPDDLEASDA